MATVHFTLHAQRLLGAGKTNEAITVLEEGLKEFPEYATAYSLLARAYLQLQDVPTAYEVVSNAVQRFPLHRGLKLLHEQLDELLRASPAAPSGIEPTSLPREEDQTPSLPADQETAAPAEAGVPLASSTAPESSAPSSTEAVPADPIEIENEPSASEQPIAFPAEQIPERSTDIDCLPVLPEVDSSSPPPLDLSPHMMPELSIQPEETESAVSPSVIADEPALTATEAISLQASVAEEKPMPNEALKEQPVPSPDPPGTTISSDAEEPMPSLPHDPNTIAESASQYSMRLVETATIDSRAMRMLRASNIRLIPGLEFAPLRIEVPATAQARTTTDFPPFRPIRGSQRQQMRPRAPIPTTPAELEAELRARMATPVHNEQKTSLELLAEQLERARIHAPESSASIAAEEFSDPDEPSVVSETMALIYERQGAIDQAIKAYTILARLNPDRRAYFEEKIAQLRDRTS